MIKSILRLIIGFMPGCILKNVLFQLLGWKIDRRAKIGLNVFWNVGFLTISNGAKIGSLNTFRDVNQIFIEPKATIGNLNWVSASPQFGNPEAPSFIFMGKESVITNRHYFDVSGGFKIGAGSAITGVRSTVITHGVNPSSNIQELRSVTVGQNSLIGSNAVFVPGAIVGDFQVFGMGSLISGIYADQYALHISEKAKYVKSLSSSSDFFNRLSE